MNATTKLTADGSVALPQDILDKLGLEPGQVLEIVASAGGIYLRPPFVKSGRSVEEVLAHLRSIVKYDGPTLPVEQLGFPSPEEWQQRS